jgi:hypothetical protein
MGFQPVEFGIGLAIFACSPTSLSQVRWVTGRVQWWGQDQGHQFKCASRKPCETAVCYSVVLHAVALTSVAHAWAPGCLCVPPCSPSRS